MERKLNTAAMVMGTLIVAGVALVGVAPTANAEFGFAIAWYHISGPNVYYPCYYQQINGVYQNPCVLGTWDSYIIASGCVDVPLTRPCP